MAIALRQFDATEENELTLKIGDIFNVLKWSHETYCWVGRLGRKIGLFPSSVAVILEEGLL